MILADKIILLRKKSGLSQEDLADKLDVSRQSVSKWESAQSIPDLDRIIAMSNIFGVSTDLLLKDELEVEDTTLVRTEEDISLINVTMKQATDFVEKTSKKARRFGIGVLLSILSPIILILLAAFANENMIDEMLIVSLGLPILFFLVAGGVTLFILGDAATNEYKYISHKNFSTEYGVTGLAKDRKKEYQPTYNKLMVIGVVLCVLSTMPLFALVPTNNDFLILLGVCILLAIVAVGASLLTYVFTKNSGYDQLLQEGNYTKEVKSISTLVSVISTVYWLMVTAAFLIVSYFAYAWNWSWLIWAVAGLIYAAWLTIMKAAKK